MSFVDTLVRIRDYVDRIRTRSETFLSRDEFGRLYDLVWDLLEQLLVIFYQMFVEYKVYPPDKLKPESTKITAEVIATGNGGAHYTGNYSHQRLVPFSIKISVNLEDELLNVSDDGSGRLIGDVSYAYVSTINYETGAFEIYFRCSIPNDCNVVSDYEYYSIGTNYVILRWDTSIGKSLYGYYLYRLKEGDTEWTKITLGDDTGYTDSGLDSNTNYSYKVTGFSYSGQSGYLSPIWYLNSYLNESFPESITQSYSNIVVYSASRPALIKRAGFYLEVSGEDADNDLSLEMDLELNNVSIFETKPKITKDADNRVNTFYPATGVVVGELNMNNLLLDPSQAGKDKLIMSLNLVRSSSPAPDVEIQGFVLYLELESGNLVESDVSNTITIKTLAS